MLLLEKPIYLTDNYNLGGELIRDWPTKELYCCAHQDSLVE